MKSKYKPFLAICLCFGLAGCDTYTAAPYGVSVGNDVILKHFAPANVTVRPFTEASDPSMLCRLVGPIHLPGNVTPQAYITKALFDELELAGLTSGSGPAVTLTGRIDKFSFDSMFEEGSWNLAITVVSSNGAKLSVSNKYDFAASFVGDAACHNVSDALEPAVQALIRKLVSDPGFAALLKTQAQAGPGNV
ncbi:hypothetical protein AiwAL_05905 [Acidiphilium sp. AL]|uniref:Lipoprotein n=1 Tax=Acidiphilium iwatense TaxID=768198 RepID=A0ABS9DTT0_9PROT|nr:MULTISPECIES: hypothetical protein [Acidiphilium]MCF3945558.1 hypothetical protein [Acidiphilium iwatense]MCU4159637.1 hypothetical protein [Acidiphilium sp. AL]